MTPHEPSYISTNISNFLGYQYIEVEQLKWGLTGDQVNLDNCIYGWNRKGLCTSEWRNRFLSETGPNSTALKSSKWNLLHMIPYEV